MSKEQAQNTYLQLQAIENQLKEIQEQVVHIESKKQEISTMCDGLEELKKSKEGSKTLSPVGLGIYANSKILDTKN